MTSVRVVIVDDSESNREGMAAMLGRFDDVEVLAVLDFDEALRHDPELWHLADVALLDGGDETAPDQMQGVVCTEHIRGHTREVAVVVVTGHFLHDRMRYRVREAGADGMVFRPEVTRSAEALHALVLAPPRLVPTPMNHPPEISDQAVNNAIRRITDDLAIYELTLADVCKDDAYLESKIGRRDADAVKDAVKLALRRAGLPSDNWKDMRGSRRFLRDWTTVHPR